MPAAVNNVYGFVLMGTSVVVKRDDLSPEDNANLVTMLSTNDITPHESLQKFWLLEELPYYQEHQKEEEECEAVFSSDVARDATGRYIIKLLFKDSSAKLGNSS